MMKTRRSRSGPARSAAGILATTILALSGVRPLGAETGFTGELKPEVVFNIPGSRGYTDTPLNAGNIWGYNDLMFRNQIDLKIDSRSETGALDLWFQLMQYPMADLLTGSAAIAEAMDSVGSGDLAGYSAAAGGLFVAAEPYIFALDVMRASATWQPSDSLKITFGRQSFLTGYGYGWNPVDLANPPKDPTAPQAYLRGVDALTLQFSPASWLNGKVYGALPSAGFAWGYDEVLAGGEFTFYIPSLEIILAGLWGGVESSSDDHDRYPHAGAAAFYADVLGMGLYGEAAVRSRSRRNSPGSGTTATSLADGPVWSALAGLEYYFPSGMLLAAEYFYNGEGWDSSDRQDYASALDNLEPLGEFIGEYMSLYTPTYYGEHYLLLNLMLPWYTFETTFNLNAIWGIDSATLVITPNASVNLNYEGTLVSEIWYSGQFSLDDGQNGEAALAPVRHSLWMNLRYYF